MNPPSVFQYRDYRDFLQDYIEERKRHRGLSYRYFAAKAGFGSPSYIQQVIQGKRNLRSESALKLARAFQLPADQTKYFLLLVALGEAASPKERKALATQLDKLSAYARNKCVTDAGFFSSWLHPVLWELATVRGFRLTVDGAYERLKGLATKSQIREALSFLLRRGYLVPSEKADVYLQANSVFDPLNDRECLELQRMHRQFLELAAREVRGDQAMRELQNLTIAIPKEKIQLVKERIRRMIGELQVELAGASDAELVYHIQVAAFGVTAPEPTH